MSERYSILRPLTMKEQENFTLLILGFFAPLNATKFRKLLGKPTEVGKLFPLSVNDLFKYMREVKGINEIDRFHYAILLIVKKLEQVNILCVAGSDTNFSMGSEKYYYTIKESTNLQKANMLWIGEILGLEYIQYKLRNFVVPITGRCIETEKLGIGTGTLINSDTILTCEHVLSDMKVDDSIEIADKIIAIKEIKKHSKVDVGFIKLSEPLDLGFQILFGEPNLLCDILTMGYPPVPMTREAYLISQKGEINSIVQNYDGAKHFIYSSITRPGNSGGPIFSKCGHLVGISTRQLERQNDEGEEKNVVPFFQAVTSTEIIKALKELEANISIAIEDYQ